MGTDGGHFLEQLKLRNMQKIKIKRIYEDPSNDDGYRILVDRVWPRGVSKKEAKLDAWMKEIAPSEKLRKWFDHDPEKFEEFAQKYRKELVGKKACFEEIRQKAKGQTVTLLYGAGDTVHNQARVLQNRLQE